MAVRYYRKVIQIKAEDSPNVAYALEQIARGEQPTGLVIVPGVLPWNKYQERRQLWDPQQQCVGLDAEFWEGAELLLFPPEWLNLSALAARTVGERVRKREARAIGIDPGEGQANTCLTAVDEWGIIEQWSAKTPNTAVIRSMVIDFGRKHGAPPENWMFDRGGGGLQIADSMREDGFPVRSVGFGESVMPELRSGMTTLLEREEIREERYAYKNRRAQMYGEAANLLDPHLNEHQFAIPAEYRELRRQLAPIPRWRDREGRLFLPPKHGKPGETSMETLIGCSPDEADSFVLAVHAMLHDDRATTAGAL